MKIINKTVNNLSHFEEGKMYFLDAGQFGDYPNNIAEIWLKIKGVEKYATPEDLEAIKKENEKLKKQVEEKEVKPVKVEAKTTKAKAKK